MSGYTSFAIAGAGPTMGGRIAKALLAHGVSVVALTRPTSTSSGSLPEGVKVASVDYADIPAVTSALREHKVDVVISALAYGALSAQTPLGDAAKAAGVKLFVPSEYGMPTEGGKEGHMIPKSQFADHLKSLGVPSARIYNGLFMEFIPWLTGVDHGKFHILGKGDKPISTTSLDDVSGFIAYILTSLPPSKLQNATFRIEGERTSLAAIGALYAPKVPTAHVTELPEGFTKQTFLHGQIEKGRLSSGWNNYTDSDEPENAASGNAAWAGHQWKSVKEALGL
ncbi:NAD(P)-binding protein [Leucogyrophana mollusca]|uniref:NAD(P)-binding protein n=1 Tax=Leucogyrophana mollusca TaxID=85980 RepID=A0ACB8B6G2_9AGAM|nr:NAD(P)-binding protein [Leucogyrophana mollusca]